MAIDYTSTKLDIAALIKNNGMSVVLNKTDSSTAKAYGLWGKSEKVDIQMGISQVIGERKTMYLAATMKKTPEVGDSVTVDGTNWGVEAVELYRPTKITIAYMLTLSN